MSWQSASHKSDQYTSVTAVNCPLKNFCRDFARLPTSTPRTTTCRVHTPSPHATTCVVHTSIPHTDIHVWSSWGPWDLLFPFASPVPPSALAFPLLASVMLQQTWPADSQSEQSLPLALRGPLYPPWCQAKECIWEHQGRVLSGDFLALFSL